jgi:NAD(P)-dependent dehydrogenase (short-subunit alcohol dehydrogenase family)
MIMDAITEKINIRQLIFAQMAFRQKEASRMVVVVTGGGQGIGFQTARIFAILGAKVVLAELSPEWGRKAENDIRAEGGEATFFQTDISDPESVMKMAQWTRDHYGTADVVINNAIYCPVKSVTEMDLETWDKVVAVNLRGTFLGTKAFLDDMVAQHRGVIINMVSVEAMPGLSAYIATKQAIVGFSESLALEVNPEEIQVIPFAPGMVNTPSIQAVSGDLAPKLGVTREQFLNLSLDSAYDGLMPPEHAGAATAYLVLRVAREFHGEMVNGYDILVRAGLNKRPSSPADVNEGSSEQNVQIMASELPEVKEATIQNLIVQVSGIIAESIAELDRMPIFVRPLVKTGFKSKTGLSMTDWQRTFSEVQGNLTSQSPEDHRFLAARLVKLKRYYQELPAETMKFTRDPKMIKTVIDLANLRAEKIQNLLDTLLQ